MTGNILVIEDDLDMCNMLSAGLGRRGYTVATFTSGTEGLAAVVSELPDVVLADIHLPDKNGLEICNSIATNQPDIPVIVMTAFGSMDTAIAAIRAGAYDFVTKPLDLDILAMSLDRAVRYRNLQDTVKKLRNAVKHP